MDVPALDKKPNLAKPFTVRNGMLVSLGKPAGHLLTEKEYANYRLEVEYRFAGKPGITIGRLNCYYTYILPQENKPSNDFITVSYKPNIIKPTPPCRKLKGYIYNWKKNANHDYQCSQTNPQLCSALPYMPKNNAN